MNPADPLAQLKDIHLPPSPGPWPPAPGWWILLPLLLIATGLLLRHWRKRRRARLQRERLAAALDACWSRYQAHGDKGRLAGECNAWLRRAAMTRFPEQGVASLAGDAWLEFLDRHGGGGGFTTEPGCVLRDAAYRPAPDIDPRGLYQLTRHWVLQDAA